MEGYAELKVQDSKFDRTWSLSQQQLFGLQPHYHEAAEHMQALVLT